MGIQDDRDKLPDMSFLGEGVKHTEGDLYITWDQEVIGEYLHSRIPYLPGAKLDFLPDWTHPFFNSMRSIEDQTPEAIADSVGLHMLLGIYVAHKLGLNVDEQAGRMLRVLHKRIQDDTPPIEYEGQTPSVPGSSATEG